MSLPGEVRTVDDVPAAFASLVAESRPATFAVSGGGTARRCYEALAASRAVAWEGVDVFVGDERWVPVDHADSNEGMARAVLLDRVPVKAVHSMRDAGSTIEAAAAAYDALVGSIDAIDFIHLGLGRDGHTASLFPGAAALEERERLVVATGDDEHPHPRLTVTYPGIARSRLVVFTVEGAAKREALARVDAGEDLPATRVRAPRIVWLVDHAALGH